MQVGIGPITANLDTLTLYIAVIDVLINLEDQCIEEVLKDDIWHLDSVRSRVEDRVHFAVRYEVCAQVGHSVVVQKGAESKTLAASRPEEVIVKLDVLEPVWVLHFIREWCSKVDVLIALIT